MITSLRIRYFKRFADVSFDLRPLSVLTGLNGTGKSTTLQSLLLTRQLADAPAGRVVQLNGPYGLALGEAHEVLHPDAPESAIEIELGRDTSGVVEGPSVHRFTVPDEQALYLRVADDSDLPPAELCGSGSAFTYLCAERLAPAISWGSQPNTPTSSESRPRRVHRAGARPPRDADSAGATASPHDAEHA